MGKYSSHDARAKLSDILRGVRAARNRLEMNEATRCANMQAAEPASRDLSESTIVDS
jgi:hypothetical protein